MPYKDDVDATEETEEDKIVSGVDLNKFILPNVEFSLPSSTPCLPSSTPSLPSSELIASSRALINQPLSSLVTFKKCFCFGESFVERNVRVNIYIEISTYNFFF